MDYKDVIWYTLEMVNLDIKLIVSLAYTISCPKFYVFRRPLN